MCRYFLLLLSFSSLLILTSCGGENCFEGSGQDASKAIDVGSFTSIENASPFDLTINQGSPDVNITGDDNLIDLIVAEVKDNRLVIHTDVNCVDTNNVKIHVQAPAILKILASGSGGTTIESVYSNGALMIENTGSGDLNFYDITNTQALIVNLKGSGNITGFKGQLLDDITIEHEGSGTFTSSEYPSRTVRAHIRGSGDIHVWATLNMDANIYDSGNIYLRGNPRLIENNAGTGTVIRQ